MKSLINEINEMKYLLGYKRGVVISEQETATTPTPTPTPEPKNSLGDIYYQRCEGGEAIIDPESYIVSEIKKEDGRPIITFIKEPRTGKDESGNFIFNNGESESIRTCLGGDIDLIDRCWSILEYNGQKQADWEVDCKTGVDK
jgi:hypothetical protein